MISPCWLHDKSLKKNLEIDQQNSDEHIIRTTSSHRSNGDLRDLREDEEKENEGEFLRNDTHIHVGL